MPGHCGTFAETCQHTPRPVVLAAARAAGEAGADCLVVLGGSSVVDLAKGVAIVLAEGDDFDAMMLRYDPDSGPTVPPLPNPKLPQIDLPTTLSGAEFTAAAGITDPGRGEKDIYLDQKLTPRWVVLDPTLTVETPARLWAGTGMKIVADTIETMTGRRSSILTDTLAQGALELLVANLVTATIDPDDHGSRTRCMYAVGMLLSNLLNGGLGLVAGLRHQIGGGHGVPHGEASTIVLPHVMRWNLSHAGDAYGRIARRLGLAGADALIAHLEQMTIELSLPTRLSDVGVSPDDHPSIAEHVLHDMVVGHNPRPVTHPDDVMEILRNAG
jgi:maleylacetate reductase